MNRQSAAVMNWRNRTKLKLMEYKGGKCSGCGYNKLVPPCYHFHHNDPSLKEFVISGKSWSFERLKAEVDKCTLYCGNCHAELHWKQQQESRELRNKTVKAKRLDDLTCACGVRFHPVNARQKFCTNTCAKMFQRKVTRPTKEELTHELKESSWVALGKKYGVSDNAVRKWARGFGLI